MFLKYKARKVMRKIANGSSGKEIRNAVGDVVREASRQLSRRLNRVPVKVSLR